MNNAPNLLSTFCAFQINGKCKYYVIEMVIYVAMQKLTPAEEEEQLKRTIFVGNLPATWKGKSVKRLFLQCAFTTTGHNSRLWALRLFNRFL